MKSKLTQRFTFVICVLAMVCSLFFGGCVPPAEQNIDLADVEATFKEDLPILEKVVEYLEQLSKSLHTSSIWIRGMDEPIYHSIGEEMPIEENEYKVYLAVLFERGYLRISYDEGSVEFWRWRKLFCHEYGSGFAYAKENNGDLHIQYIIHQRELSVDDWYYYEEDYNEWRVRKSTDTAYGH